MTAPDVRVSRWIAALAILYPAFVLYGSLIPFQVTPQPISAALARFLATPLYELGAENRADWVANGILFMPLAFVWCAWLAPRIGHVADIAVLLTAAVFAVLLEFAQLWFAPRTVSLNDIFAEWVGTATGIVIWIVWGRALLALASDVVRSGRRGIAAAALLYVGAYLAFSFFPFDLVIGWGELRGKLASENVAPVMSPGCGTTLRCAANLTFEVIAAAPLGVFVLLVARLRRVELGVLAAGAIGAAIGLAIELGQILVYSGMTQGISILTRGLGTALGVAAGQGWNPAAMAALRSNLRPTILIAAAGYTLVVAAIMSEGTWQVAGALARLGETNFLPLYYHYYTTEQAAFVSLLANCALYAPIGFGLWSWRQRIGPRAYDHGAGPGTSAALAAIVAVVIETSRLFKPAAHPDPTNILIAALAAAFAFAAAQWLARCLTNPFESRPATRAVVDPRPPTIPRPPPRRAQRRPTRTNATPRRVVAAVLALAVLAIAALYPVAPWALAIALICYVAVLLRFPFAWLVVLPAALPVLDLMPYSGWLYFDEFDLVVLATVACTIWHFRFTLSGLSFGRTAAALLIATAASYAVSGLIGVLPLQSLDWNAVSTYASRYNSLRVAKGFLWAVLLLPALAAAARRGADVSRPFSLGMALGLAGVVVAAVIERHTWPGLLDFADEYRISALFSSMHAGGQHIDAYLAAALPFIAFVFTRRPRWLGCTGGLVLAVAAGYTTVVTYSRWLYVAAALALAVTVLAIAAARWRAIGVVPAAAAIALGGGAAAIAVDALQLPQIKSRFSLVEQDAALRVRHWDNALAMRDTDLETELFGMGLGSFPRLFADRNPDRKPPAGFRFEVERGDRFLRLSTGHAHYFTQRIRPAPEPGYRIFFDARTNAPSARLALPICEKALQDSYNCVWPSITFGDGDGRWHTYELAADLSQVGHPRDATGWLGRRPIALALYYSGGAAPLDIDNILLLDRRGRNLIENGGFDAGPEHWYYTVENHLEAHEFNLWIHLLFERGWFGLVAFTGLALAALAGLARRCARGDWLAALPLGGLAGMLCVGFVESLLDTPRLVLLAFLLIWLGIAPGLHGSARSHGLPAFARFRSRT